MNQLIKLGLGTIRAYEEAIEGAESRDLRAKLTELMCDHQQHVSALSALVTSCGGKPAKRPDLLGILLQGFSSVLSMNNRTALLAAWAIEEIANNRFRMALGKKLPQEASDAIEKVYQNHQAHVVWIKHTLQKLD
jgi:uncharacterized protein (TIGR02284 family)